MSGLARRLITAFVLLPLIILAIRTGPLLLALLLAVIALLGARELARVLRGQGLGLPVWLMASSAILLVASQLREGPFDNLFALALVILAALLVQLIRQDGRMLVGLSCIVFGAIYVGLLPAYLLRFYDLRGLGAVDPWPVTYALLLVWGCDTGAFFTGSLIGRHKLWPRVSPGKTWEGAFGGLLVAIVLAVAFGHWAGDLSLEERIIAGLLTGLFAQAGDLAESQMKREASMKDSGSTLPGHGGVLDRLDSLVIAVPVLYYWLRWAVRIP